MKNCVLAVTAIAALAGVASADTVVVNLAGWNSVGAWNSGLNTSTTISLPVGSTITGASWQNVTFTANSPSWIADLVFDLADGDAFGDYWDVIPAPDMEDPGTYTGSGVFGVDGVEDGGSFVVASGTLFVQVYESFNDSGVTPDATFASGQLVIEYTVPAPGAAALLGLGGLAASRRRRA